MRQQVGLCLRCSHPVNALLSLTADLVQIVDSGARLLVERELDRPRFLDVCGRLPEPSAITMNWSRDAWQAAARLSIAEKQIGQTPITLNRLTADIWRTILLEAYGCLDPDKHHRGRAKQSVTLRSGNVEKWVSPHLHLGYVVWRTPPRSQDEAEWLVRQGREALDPIYEVVRKQSA